MCIDGNQLDGSIPDELRALTKLQTLDLASNSLIGVFPTSVLEALASSLQTVDLEKNQLTGNPFTELDYSGVGDGSVVLRDMKLSNNLMRGEISGSVFSSLANLEKLWIAENSFTGVVPSEIGFLSNLGALSN